MKVRIVFAVIVVLIAALSILDRSDTSRFLGVCGSQYSAMGFCLSHVDNPDSWCAGHIERERQRIIELQK